MATKRHVKYWKTAGEERNTVTSNIIVYMGIVGIGKLLEMLLATSCLILDFTEWGGVLGKSGFFLLMLEALITKHCNDALMLVSQPNLCFQYKLDQWSLV